MINIYLFKNYNCKTFYILCNSCVPLISFAKKHHLLKMLCENFPKFNPVTFNYITAPPAFKVKHRKNRATESRSPFSTDRKYDLPTGSGFHVKKSEKKLTEFKEFKHHEGEWKVGT